MSDSKTGNEPAFAAAAPKDSKGYPPRIQAGLTKREYYAAHCPLAVLKPLTDGIIKPYEETGIPQWFLEELVAISFRYADAMIARLEAAEANVKTLRTKLRICLTR